MANWFEDLSRTVADEKIGRRTAIRRITAGVAGIAVAAGIPGIALAKSKACPGGGGVCGTYVNCANNSNTNCFCFTNASNKAFCGCSQFCSQLQACSSNHDCPKGSFCAINTCCASPSPNVCTVKCKGKNKNCQLGSGHGTTSAHR
ncbi:MAG TPA: hypothetical protein VFA09_23730 [Ktedonobacteraceae bacterium]|nr:hypothetical protein [Ktedonobacteraceae bacterium]